MKGRVVKSTGSWYNVRMENGGVIECRIKGKLRLVDRRSTNPVVVGDLVEVENENEDAVINEVLPRNNYIIRQSSKNRTAEHILAANLDQAVLIVTISQPRTSTGFIDRFLVTANAYHIPTVVVFNKSDLYGDEEKEFQSVLTKVYEDAGYRVLVVSALKSDHVEKVKEIMNNKISLMAGHSGTGKSTLINKIIPNLNQKTGEISEAHLKGMHTTTFAEMFELPFGGSIIDTPGIKEFGILDFEEAEVSQFFPEMEKHLHDCKFNNCLHINEPKCAVKAAVESGMIATFRYQNYCAIIAEIRSDEKIYD